MKLLTTFLIFVSLASFSQNWEYNTLKQLQSGRNARSDQFFNDLSQSADYVGIASPLLLTGIGFIMDDDHLKQDGISSGIAVLGTYGIGYLLKKSIKRDRPFIKYPEFQPFQNKESYSMPSGSTAIAFATATNLTYAFPKWYVAVPAYSYATAVAFSRLRLAEHYPTDVLAGAVLGASSVWVSRKLTTWVNKKR